MFSLGKFELSMRHQELGNREIGMWVKNRHATKDLFIQECAESFENEISKGKQCLLPFLQNSFPEKIIVKRQRRSLYSLLCVCTGHCIVAGYN